eukprot:scaffold41196_cov63-Attheya_sp.AAC.3
MHAAFDIELRSEDSGFMNLSHATRYRNMKKWGTTCPTTNRTNETFLPTAIQYRSHDLSNANTIHPSVLIPLGLNSHNSVSHIWVLPVSRTI